MRSAIAHRRRSDVLISLGCDYFDCPDRTKIVWDLLSSWSAVDVAPSNAEEVGKRKLQRFSNEIENAMLKTKKSSLKN